MTDSLVKSRFGLWCWWCSRSTSSNSPIVWRRGPAKSVSTRTGVTIAASLRSTPIDNFVNKLNTQKITEKNEPYDLFGAGEELCAESIVDHCNVGNIRFFVSIVSCSNINFTPPPNLQPHIPFIKGLMSVTMLSSKMANLLSFEIYLI